MSDLQVLFLVLVLLYGWECACWVPRGSVVFSTWWGRRWRMIHPATLLGNARGGFVFACPLPPLGTVLTGSHIPLVALAGRCPGVCRHLCQSGLASAADRTLSPLRRNPFPRVRWKKGSGKWRILVENHRRPDLPKNWCGGCGKSVKCPRHKGPLPSAGFFRQVSMPGRLSSVGGNCGSMRRASGGRPMCSSVTCLFWPQLRSGILG